MSKQSLIKATMSDLQTSYREIRQLQTLDNEEMARIMGGPRSGIRNGLPRKKSVQSSHEYTMHLLGFASARKSSKSY